MTWRKRETYCENVDTLLDRHLRLTFVAMTGEDTEKDKDIRDDAGKCGEECAPSYVWNMLSL